MVLRGEIVNSIAVGGILAAHAVTDRAMLRPVDAPWTVAAFAAGGTMPSLPCLAREVPTSHDRPCLQVRPR